jgi:hypothetical protein
MVVESDAHVTRIIEHDRKVYLTITRADARQLEALGTILEPFEGARPQTAGLWDLDGLQFKKTGKTAQMAGIRCDIWVGRRSGASRNDASEVCLGASGIGFGVAQFVDALMADSNASGQYADNGLPRKALGSGLLKLSLVKDGSPTTLEVISVRPSIVDDTLFAMPAGYTEVRMADMLQRVQAWLDDAKFRGLPLTPRYGLGLSYPVTDDPRVSQPPALDRCAWRSIQPGGERGEGEVTYQVTAEGVPDTNTLTVVRLSRADSPTFRAAAQKVVGACRFTAPTADRDSAPTLVRQRISFLKGDAETESADSKIYGEESSPELEHATTVKCQPDLHEFGVFRVDMVIGTDGRPEPGRTSAVNVTTNTTLGEAAVAFAGCVFNPARYRGVPVRQAVQVIVRVKDPCAAPAPDPPETFAVSEVTLGKGIAADKRVLSSTVTFGPRDTIYVSVATTGSALSKILIAKWTFQDGQTVTEDSQTIAPTGPAVTEFHISKRSRWPVGKYKVEIVVDGSPVATKEFGVREE